MEQPNSTATCRMIFSLTKVETDILKDRLEGLRGAGVPVREGTFLRAVVEMTPVEEMIAASVEALKAALQPGAPWHKVVRSPGGVFRKANAQKLDRVIRTLAAAGLIATRTSIVRATLQRVPSGRDYAPTMREFLTRFPFKNRGIHIARARAKKRHG